MAILTADICARGVIAACEVFHLDPVVACLAKKGNYRRPVVQAALAAADLTGLTRRTIAKIYGCDPTGFAAVERSDNPDLALARRRAREAMVAAGLDLSGLPLPAKRGRPTAAPTVGTVVAPPPAAQRPARPSPMPATTTLLNDIHGAALSPAATVLAVDHTSAIREAMRRRQTVAIEVVGVEADKALLPPTSAHACHWPLGDLKEGTLRSCGAPAVDGRMYCPEHCKKAGQKQTPRVGAAVGRVAEPYGAHELEAEG